MTIAWQSALELRGARQVGGPGVNLLTLPVRVRRASRQLFGSAMFAKEDVHLQADLSEPVRH